MSDPQPKDALHALCLADPLWAERYSGWTELGQGASATVVRTLSLAAGEEVALKVFQRLDADDRRRFQQEVRHSQRLDSPFVVRTYSPFVRGSLAWIEMEWVDGPDLRQELLERQAAGRPFELSEVLPLGAALAQALHTAHAAGVIHRDVKPANVLLPRGGRPVAKLSDFGISRVAGAARVTATGLLTGTPQFAAPEVAAGHPADAASDVYGLALVLYLILSNNRFPFDVSEPESPAQWLRAHAHSRPRPIEQERPETPAELAGLIARGLSKDPHQRPAAADFVLALTRGPAVRSPAGRRAGRGRVLATLAGGAAVGLILGLALRQAPAPRPPTAATPADAPVGSGAEAARLRATLGRGWLRLVSDQLTAPGPLDVRLSDDEGKRACEMRTTAGLKPGEALVLAIDACRPVPPDGWQPARLLVQGADTRALSVSLRRVSSKR